MSVERRTIAEIGDIKAVVLECPNCGRRVGCGLTALTSFPDHCDCTRDGEPKIPIGKAIDVQAFLNVMTGLGQPAKTGSAKILLEFDGH